MFVAGLTRMWIVARTGQLIQLGIMHGDEHLAWLYGGSDERDCCQASPP